MELCDVAKERGLGEGAPDDVFAGAGVGAALTVV